MTDVIKKLNNRIKVLNQILVNKQNELIKFLKINEQLSNELKQMNELKETNQQLSNELKQMNERKQLKKTQYIKIMK